MAFPIRSFQMLFRKGFSRHLAQRSWPDAHVPFVNVPSTEYLDAGWTVAND